MIESFLTKLGAGVLTVGIAVSSFIGGQAPLESIIQPIIEESVSEQTLGAAPQFVAGKIYNLSGSGVAAGDTSITLTSFKLPTSNALITMSDFGTASGTKGYLTLEPQSATNKEFVSFTGITQNADGSATLTGVSRGLLFTSPYTASSTLQRAHAGGTRAVISNPPQLYQSILDYINDATVAGAPDSSTLTKGLVEVAIGVEAASTTGVGQGNTTAPLALTTAISTSTKPASGHYVVVTNSSGQIDSSFTSVILPVGSVIPYASSTAPTGFLPADGSAVSRSTYSTLYSVIGTAYGAGDGSTTFNIPNLSSRIIVGYSSTTPTKVWTFASRSSNEITVTGAVNATSSSLQTGQKVVYTTDGSVITGLTSGTTYYLIRTAYNVFSLATTLANANSGTAITLSGDGTGTQTFTATYSARPIAEMGGTETDTTVPSHRHTATNQPIGTLSNTVDTSTTPDESAPSSFTGTTGSEDPNNIPLYTVLNYIIKY